MASAPPTSRATQTGRTVVRGGSPCLTGSGTGDKTKAKNNDQMQVSPRITVEEWKAYTYISTQFSLDLHTSPQHALNYFINSLLSLLSRGLHTNAVCLLCCFVFAA